MGDGGSYFVGFSVGWVAVILVERNPQVSPFAALLVCLHPVTEVLFSICRRFFNNSPLSQPDSSHLHSLINIKLVRLWFPFSNLTLSNSITGILVGLLTFILMTISVYIYDSTLLCIITCILYVLVYTYLYFKMIQQY
jgi:UDP-N-acetylmuramyl pentapeptide phosphotransferase/UDP-N-acetylglucosamine-1-phosphate transferase